MTDTEPTSPPPDPIIPRETVPISDLKPHPRNYRIHPEEQVKHLASSIRQHGFYKNIVVARDLTILAGHGAVLAATEAGMTHIPVARLDLDPDSTTALKIVTGDNELGRFAEIDDRILTEILKEVSEDDPLGLLGTGYDEMILANLLFVTRNAAEIAGFDEAAEWSGLPDYDPEPDKFRLLLSFASARDRHDFIEKFDLWGALTSAGDPKRGVFSGSWPISDVVKQDGGLRYSQPEEPAPEPADAPT